VSYKLFVFVAPAVLLTAAACQSTQHSAPRSAPPAVVFELARGALPEQGNWKCDPLLSDLNGDGRLDLVAHVRLSPGPQAWFGDGRGGWEPAGAGLQLAGTSCGGGLDVGDLNRDGHLDLAVADHCEGIFVYLGDGAGHWQLAAEELYPAALVPEGESPDLYRGSEDLTLGDVNGDRLLDLVAGASDMGGGVGLWLGDGTGTNWAFQTASGLPGQGWATRVQLVDVNADQRLDVVASYWAGPRVWLGDGQGKFREASQGLPTPSMQGIYNGLAVADFNGDGRLDLTIANWVDGPELYLQQADGSWARQADVFPELLGGAYGLATGDFDGDGRADLVVSGRLTTDVGYVYGVFLLLGDGAGHWQYVDGSGLPPRGLPFTWGLAAGDVNGDGRLDVAAGSGGLVATSLRFDTPVVPAGMLLWRGAGK
jgi:hypothetical protein